MEEAEIIVRWSFLEEVPDACSVVSRRMELLYLNATARSLVSPDWFGSRCWQVFPVEDGSCASRCPAVRAVNRSEDIVYCEETIYPDEALVTLGVAVIPLGTTHEHGERSILLLRPKRAGICEDAFRRELLEDAEHLSALSFSYLDAARPDSPGGLIPRSSRLT